MSYVNIRLGDVITEYSISDGADGGKIGNAETFFGGSCEGRQNY